MLNFILTSQKYFIAAPSQPEKPTASQITNNSALISWPMPKSGSLVDGYFVEIKERNNVNWERVTKNSIKRNKYVVKGLVLLALIKSFKNVY